MIRFYFCGSIWSTHFSYFEVMDYLRDFQCTYLTSLECNRFLSGNYGNLLSQIMLKIFEVGVHQCWTGIYIYRSMPPYVSIININNGVKEPTHGFQNCNINQILMLVLVSRWQNLYILELLFGSRHS